MPYEFGAYGDAESSNTEGVPSAEDVFGIDLGNDPNFGGYLSSVGKGTTLNTALNMGTYAALGLDPTAALGGVGKGFMSGLVGKGVTPLSDMLGSLFGIETPVGQTASTIGEKVSKGLSMFLGPIGILTSPFWSNVLGPMFGKGIEELALLLGYYPMNPALGLHDEAGAYADVFADLFGTDNFGAEALENALSDPAPNPYLGEDAFAEEPWGDPLGGLDPGDIGPTGPSPGDGLPGNY